MAEPTGPVDLIGLLRALTGASPSVPLTIHPDGVIPGYRRSVQGVYDIKDKTVQAVDHKWDKDMSEFINTVAHEFSHAASYAGKEQNKISALDLFVQDLQNVGKIDPNLTGSARDWATVAVLGPIVKSATKNSLPSSGGVNGFEEARANATANRVAAQLGKKGDPAVDKFLNENPDFKEWIDSGLGSQFISSPRLKSFSPGLLTQLVEAIFPSTSPAAKD